MSDSPLHNEKTVERSPNDTQSDAGKQSLNDVDPNAGESSPRNLHGVKVTRPHMSGTMLDHSNVTYDHQWLMTITAILSTTLLFSLDTTIVANVQPSIIKEFGEVSKLSWLGTAFALGSASTILPWSKAYGVLNVKWLYISHVIVFETGSALCGGAPDMNALIVGRAIAGFGASGIKTDLYGTDRIGVGTRNNSRSSYWWSLHRQQCDAFYINLVVGAVFAPVYLFLLPSLDLQKDVPLRQRLVRNFDWLGNLFFIGGICCFTLAITFGGSLFSWSSASEIALWVVAGVLFLVFCLTQAFHPLVNAQHKLYPTIFLRRPVMVMLQLAVFMSSVSLLIPVYYIPLFYQFAKGSSALGSAVHLLPFVIMVVIFVIINGSLMAKLGYYMPWYLFGGALVLIGSALMYTVTATTLTSAVYGYTVLIGAGAGSFLQAGFSVTQALLEPEEITDASRLGQSIGIVISLAIAGAIFQNRAVSNVVSILPGVDISGLRSAITGTDSAYFASLSPAERGSVTEGIVKALGDVYVVVIVAGATVILLAVFLPKTKLFTSG
ncbi:hypothetical protein HO133_005947 [Letharia lupina]|uniref:Major facilitator superfamily (MFS) profile domain-containing protein n=1 Tax=Letharia lupina TaxID=560253 RepID=A0A8H6C8F6_9LECA|nr:uncharacterized protein HO133_005947 [Letharia lupina]KAF6218596.1 hypothetical protein HO133_005947 [Letharia lupina]